MNNIIITTETVGLGEEASFAELRRLSENFRLVIESGADINRLNQHIHSLCNGIQVFSQSLDSEPFFTERYTHSLSTARGYLYGIPQVLQTSIGSAQGLPEAFSGPLNANEKFQRLNLYNFTNKFVVLNLLQFFEESDPNFSLAIRERLNALDILELKFENQNKELKNIKSKVYDPEDQS